jgi:ribosome recycling factor
VIKDVINECKGRMEKAIEALHGDLRAIRTGRASPALLEKLQVEYYGTPTPLNQLAGVSVPEPRMLMIRPYDRNTIAAIERAIQKSDLGLTPSNDGQIVRLMIPQLTEDRRKDLSKQVGRRVEEARVAARNIRRDANDRLAKMEKDKEISEDDLRDAQKEVQKLTDDYIRQIDEIGKAKEAEIMEV